MSRRSVIAFVAAAAAATVIPVSFSDAAAGSGQSVALAPGDTVSASCSGTKLDSTAVDSTHVSLTCTGVPPATDGTQAATTLGWGSVVSGDEFNYTGAPDPLKWGVYNSPGHAGNGVRSPAAWAVDGSTVTVSGDAQGTTGGMSAKFDRRQYGRWETRMRTNTRDPKYHPVLILWPDVATSTCPEVDYAEGTADVTMMNFYLHYGCGGIQVGVHKPVDTTQWHNYAVDWSAAGTVGYIDGVEWFRDSTHQPSGSMHQTIQLDWFPDGTATQRSLMQVDWVRVYSAAALVTPVTKVLTFVEENHSLSQMQSGMPNLYALAQRYAYANNYSALTHPSEPNYVGMTFGSTMGDTSDHSTAQNFAGPTVFGATRAAGRTAKAYAESMPSNCASSSSGVYVTKHNPWVDASSERSICAAGDVPSGALTSGALHSDIAAGTLPNIGLVIPNMNNDAHDGSLATADTWLKGWLNQLFTSPDWRAGRLAIIVTADEDNMTSVNKVLTVVLHPSLDGTHKVVSTALTHYSWTRLQTQVARVACIRSGCTAADMVVAFGLSL